MANSERAVAKIKAPDVLCQACATIFVGAIGPLGTISCYVLSLWKPLADRFSFTRMATPNLSFAAAAPFFVIETDSPQFPLRRNQAFSASDQWLLDLISPLRLIAGGPAPAFPQGLASEGLRDAIRETRLGTRIDFLQQLVAGAELPPEIAHFARAERVRSAAWNAWLDAQQSGIQKDLRAQGIRTLALKGTSLARLLHNDASSRDVHDVDLAVAAADLARAAEVLQQSGFEILLPVELLRHAPFLATASFKTAELGCVRHGPAGRLLVELHWKLYPGEPAGWPLRDGGERETLDPTPCFFYLCVQFAARGWTGLQRLCDLGDFVVRLGHQLDAREFFRLADSSGQRQNADIALELLAVLFGLRWKAHAPAWRIREATQELLRRPFLSCPPGSTLDYHRERMHFLRGWRFRVAYFHRLLQPAGEDYCAPQKRLRSRSAARLHRWQRMAQRLLPGARRDITHHAR